MKLYEREPDDFGTIAVNPGAMMLGETQLPADALCRECGHALKHHDEQGECWPYPDEPNEADQLVCGCWWFVPHVRYNPVALEYIGAAFLVWRELLYSKVIAATAPPWTFPNPPWIVVSATNEPEGKEYGP